MLSTSKVWLYGSLAFPLAILAYPLGIWLPRAYATDLGMPVAWVGVIITLAAVFDALSDPLVGYISDKRRMVLGRRKGWMTLGTPLLMLALYYLLNPTETSTIAYLAFWFISLRIGSTLVLIPYIAWGADISSEYHGRTRIVAVRQMFLILGLVVSAAIPGLVEMQYGDNTTAVMALSAYTVPVLVLLPALTAAVLWRIPEASPDVHDRGSGFTNTLRIMLQNKLFLRLVLIELLISGSEAFRNSLSLFFIEDYIGVSKPATLYILYFGMGLAAIPLWNRLARRFGKHRSLSAAIIVIATVNLAIFFLEPGQRQLFTLLFAIKGFCFAASAYLPYAMVADVIDLETMKTGSARSAGYISVLGVITKAALSMGGLALLLLSVFDYDTSGKVASAPEGLYWLSFHYTIVPSIALVGALYLCWDWPLDAEQHSRIRRIIARRKSRFVTG